MDATLAQRGRTALRLTIRDPEGGFTPVLLDGHADRYVIGRAIPDVTEADVILDDAGLTPLQCVLQWDAGRCRWLVGGWRGREEMRIDGRPAGGQPVPLEDGATLRLGAFAVIVDRHVPPESDSVTEMEDAALLVSGGAGDPDGEVAPLAGAPDWGVVDLEFGDEAPDQAEPPEAETERPDPDRRDHDRRPHPDLVLGGIARELVDARLVDGARAVMLANAAREKGVTLFRALVEDPQVHDLDGIYRHLAQSTGLPLIGDEKALMRAAVSNGWLSYPVAERRGAVLLAAEGGAPRYATIDPFDLATGDWIARCLGRKADRVLVTPPVFGSALQRLKNQAAEGESSANVLVIDISVEDERRMIEALERADTPQIVNLIFQRAHTRGASDIHIEPTEEYLLVRNRVDGILHEEISLPAAMHPEIASRIKIVSGMDVAEKRRPQDGRIGLVVHGNPIDVRVSSYPTIYGEKIVMRLLDKNALRPRPDDLGMLPRDLRKLYEKLNAPYGLVMISGPTGSGKTTTLYSCLGSIDKTAKNVLTVEDPVEYRLKGVHQMQVNERIGLTFAAGLRTILRQDPDVIMIGECRDAETAGMSIQAALTGHIVFSTVHTNDAVGVVTRLLDMGVDHFRVANALSLTIAQRLVRRICPHCATRRRGALIRRSLHDEGVTDERLAMLGIDIEDRDEYLHGQGFEHCRHTGYLGRQAVFEVFEMTNAARNLIMSPRFNADDLRRMAREDGMTTLLRHGLWMIDQDKTTHAEVIRVLGETY